MRKLWFIMIPIIVVPILAGFSIYYKNEVNNFFGTTYASNYLLIGLIAVEAFNGFLAYFFENKRNLENKQEKHKQDILTLLNFPTSTYFPEYDQLGEGKISWADYDMYQYCLSHLKSYPDLWNSFDHTRKYSENITHQVTTKIQEARDLVENMLVSFNDLPESDTYLGNTKPHFMKKRFQNTLFKNIASAILNATQVRPFEIIHEPHTPFAILTDRSGECAIGDENKLTNLLTVIKLMESDSKLYELIKEIEDLKKLVSWDKWTEFNRKRTTLIRDLTLGQKDLKGHCDYCP